MFWSLYYCIKSVLQTCKFFLTQHFSDGSFEHPKAYVLVENHEKYFLITHPYLEAFGHIINTIIQIWHHVQHKNVNKYIAFQNIYNLSESIQNFHFRRYIIRYMVGNLVLPQRYTFPNEHFEYSYPHLNALLIFSSNWGLQAA